MPRYMLSVFGPVERQPFGPYPSKEAMLEARWDDLVDIARGQTRDGAHLIDVCVDYVGRDGVHVGTVDKVRGDDIVLTRSDPAAGGAHHLIPFGWIQGVGEKVMLNKPGEQARREWMSDGRDDGGRDAFDPKRDLALGEKPNQGSDGPHILDRSFSGTYEN